MSNVFRWRMDASTHTSVMRALRREIVNSYSAHSDLPLSTVVALLPLATNQSTEISGRGAIRFAGAAFRNAAQRDLWLEFSDPAMGDFSLTLPSVISGQIAVTGDRIALAFDTPIELEIPRLATLGVNRSSYQDLVSLELTPATSVSSLRERTHPDRITQIDAELGREQLRNLLSLETEASESTRDLASLAMVLNASKSCGGDPDDPNWYVYWDKQLQDCIVHHGTIITGGQIRYQHRFGPATQRSCEQYVANNCPVSP